MNRGEMAWGRGLALVMLATLSLAGCTRTRYRVAADEEVGCLVMEKANDERWALNSFTIEMDPRSRYYDPWNRDFPPMPPDDPAAHRFMHYVDCKRGWPRWHSHGDIDQLENPYWLNYLAQYSERAEDGSIRLKLEDAVKLSIMHDPDYQTQLETLYLSALDVSTERFRFDVQFFGNAAATFETVGADLPGGPSNTLTASSGLNLQKRCATAGQLLVGFANSTVMQFTGPNTGFSTSLLNFSFIQPLLRAGGRVIALEQLTIAERGLLSNLRLLQRYRQGNYTNVAIGESTVGSLQRRGGFFGGTGLTGFTGQGSSGFGGVGDVTGFARSLVTSSTGGGTGSAAGFAGGGAGTIGGFIGLLQQLTQIRNSQETLNAEVHTLALLEANLQAGFIDIAQVDQFRQNIETERATLLQARNNLQTSMDGFKISQLGLPPSLEVSLDETLIKPFNFADPRLSELQNRISEAISSFGGLAKQPQVEEIRRALAASQVLANDLAAHYQVVHRDLEELESRVPERERTMSPLEKEQFAEDRRRLAQSLAEFETRLKMFSEAVGQLRTGLTEQTRQATADRFVALMVELSNIAGETSLVQARSRVEKITVEPINLDAPTALEIARGNRLDWMNNRAALVDTWRLIEYNANALKSDLTVRIDGNVSNAGTHTPFDFRGERGDLRAGIEWDPPFTRLIERNNFRQQLIQYQQARRQLIQFEDGVNRNVRQLLRDQRQLYTNLEIQRRAMAIAIRRVDQTREVLNKPAAPAAPGAPPTQLGPTSTLNLLTALSDLRNTQNNFISVWINYEAGRMRILRELGLMQIDDSGIWIEEPIETAVRRAEEEEPLPPVVPGQLLDPHGPSGVPTDGATPIPSAPVLPPGAAPAAADNRPADANAGRVALASESRSGS